jgi:cytochrome P450
VRSLAADVVISTDKSEQKESYVLRKGENIMIPHDLHMNDPVYFTNPTKFEPERFLVRNEDGSLGTDMGTIVS